MNILEGRTAIKLCRQWLQHISGHNISSKHLTNQKIIGMNFEGIVLQGSIMLL
jgi:hypothetical protein